MKILTPLHHFIINRTITWIIFITGAGNVMAQADIHFEQGTWSEIQSKAAKEHKLIFVDCYTSWCGPCKWMATNVFTDTSVANFFNQHFICAKFDMEKGEGQQIAKQYDVRVYPTYLFINARGLDARTVTELQDSGPGLRAVTSNVVHRTAGSCDAINFITIAKTALDPDKRLEHYTKIFETGKYDSTFILDYLTMLDNAYSPDANKVAATYLASKNDKELLTHNSWVLIQKYISDIHSREFQFLFKERREFAKIDSPKAIDSKIYSTYLQAGKITVGARTDKDDSAYRSFVKEINASGYERAPQILMQLDVSWYMRKKDWKNYAATSIKYLTKYLPAEDDYKTYNTYAWNFFENVSDPVMLKKALVWAEKSVKVYNGSANNDTYANLLFKLGRKKEAIAAEEKALELAKKENSGTTEYEATLKKFKTAD